MAKKISELGAATAPLAGTELVEVVQGGVSKRVAVSELGGDVTGPASATDNAIARFDGTTGKLVQDSGVRIVDSGNLYLPNAAGSPRYLMLDTNSTGTGQLNIQAGGGSSSFGGGLALFSHSHATKPGWVSAGISFGSGGKFTVNDQGTAQGADVFAVDSSGNVGAGTTNPNLGSFSRALTLNRTSGSTTGLEFASSDVNEAYIFTRSDGNGGLNITKVGNAPIVLNTNSAERVRVEGSGHVIPGADNTQNLGSGSLRWSTVYAGTGTINTSDAREKTPVRSLTVDEIAAANQLSQEIGVYQFLQAIEDKGNAAREHIGMTVQRAIEVMEANNLDPFNYGFICYDQWGEETAEELTTADDPAALSRTKEVQSTHTQTQTASEIQMIDGVPTLITVTEEVEVPEYQEVGVVDEACNAVLVVDQPAVQEELDEEGNVIVEAQAETYKQLTYRVPVMITITEYYKTVVTREAGDRYSFRPDELLLFVARGFEQRLAALEATV